MLMNQKTSISTVILSIASIAAIWYLTGCSATDKYHNKKHIDTISKDIGSMHKDIDRVLGIDEPSPLVEKE